MSNASSDCDLAAAVARNYEVVISHLLILLFDFISFIILGTYIWILIRIKSIHQNVRAINLSIGIGYFLRNVYTTYRSGVKIFLVIFATNPCLFQEELIKCSIESTIGRFPINAALVASNVAVVERLAATVFYQHYERYNFLFLSIAIGVFPWVYQALTSFSSIMDSLKKKSVILTYCSSLNSIGIKIDAFISNVSFTTIAALIIAIIIYVINKRIKKFSAQISGGRHISVEFQRKENLQFTKVIAAQIVGLLIAYFLNAFIAFFIANTKYEELTTFVIHKEFGSLCFPIYASVHAITALIVSPTLRTKYFATGIMKKLTGCFKPQKCFNTQISPLATPEDYFRYYETQWS